MIEKLKFLSEDQVRELAEEHGTPVFIGSRKEIRKAANEVKDAFSRVPNGATIRFAMKANPHPEFLKTVIEEGIHIDASSEFEAKEALENGIDPSLILLTSQQLPQDMDWIEKSGIDFTATSLHQLEEYGKRYPGTEVSVRLNTGLGSGFNHRNTTGGIEVGFGIWFHQGDDRGADIDAITQKYDLTVKRIHIHIGTGSDPEIWGRLMSLGIYALEHFTDASILNLGGGFKVPYMTGDNSANMQAIGQIAKEQLEMFEQKTGRKIHFEAEPGRYLSAHSVSLISTIIDRTDTGDEGDDFLKLNTGMNDFARTAMYGSQHPLVTVAKDPSKTDREVKKYVVIGHCCESSDVMTTVPGDPEQIEPRPMHEADIGDYMVLEMAGAYCGGMRLRGYNSFPDAKEIFID